MTLRMSPTNKRNKERLRQLQLRREEQDRWIQPIYSHQLTVIHHQRNQFFSTIQISLYKPRSYQGIQYKREADNGLCE